MNLVHRHEIRCLSAQDIVSAKYGWLLRWALRFSEGDREAAEDLVQDTLVAVLASRIELESQEAAEPLLYTYLKYTHLARQRRTRRQLLHRIPIVDFDSLEWAVRESCGSDPIKIQDDLRQAVAYLCWRKDTAKSASILILRFFHGYLQDEIVRVGLMSGQAVANGLLLARKEAKRYLEDAASLRVLHRDGPPVSTRKHVSVPSEELLRELQDTIFAARLTLCLPKDELVQHYIALQLKPLETSLLAHIVSCERCLDAVNDRNDIPRLLQRSPE